MAAFVEGKYKVLNEHQLLEGCQATLGCQLALIGFVKIRSLCGSRFAIRAWLACGQIIQFELSKLNRIEHSTADVENPSAGNELDLNFCSLAICFRDAAIKEFFGE